MNNDKKKMIVLSVLVLAILGIGAFQFMGQKPAPAEDKPAKSKDDGLVASAQTETEDPMALVIKKLIEEGTGPRDPFIPQATLIDVEPTGDPFDGGNQGGTNTGGTNTGGTNSGGARPGSEIGGGFPVNPLGGGNTVEGGVTLPNPNDIPYALRGVMIGERKLCMLETLDGRQIVVAEGHTFGREMETTVVRVTEDSVVIRHRGVEKPLPLHGGN